MKSKDDLTIARIRAARHRISQKFDHDPQKLVAHYIELQAEYRRLSSVRETLETTAPRVSETAGTLREDPVTYIIEDAKLLSILRGQD
jgi:hypothetical protein